MKLQSKLRDESIRYRAEISKQGRGKGRPASINHIKNNQVGRIGGIEMGGGFEVVGVVFFIFLGFELKLNYSRVVKCFVSFASQTTYACFLSGLIFVSTV